MATTRKVKTDADAPQVDKTKLKMVDKVIAESGKLFGPGSLMMLGENNHMNVDHVSTNSLAFDFVTGGGLARGRIHEIYGPEGSGKTSVTLQTIANVQRHGGMAAFIDVEHALDPHQAAMLGVDISKLVVSQPNYAEQALDIMEYLTRQGIFDIIVLDSVAALVPKAEIEGSMEDRTVGLIARIMSQALRKLTGIASQQNTILVFINQTREKVGVMYGNPETTTGGNALKFYSSIRLRVSRVGSQITKGSGEKAIPIGQHIKLNCVKNKVGTPYLKAETDFYFRGGIDLGSEVANYGSKYGVIKKQGRNYLGPDGKPLTYKGEPVTTQSALAELLHDPRNGIAAAFHDPVLKAMQDHIEDAFKLDDDEDNGPVDYDAEDADYATTSVDDSSGVATSDDSSTEDAGF